MSHYPISAVCTNIKSGTNNGGTSLKNKKLDYRGKLFEVSINSYTDTSDTIMNKVRSKLIHHNSHFILKKRYIDLEAFDFTSRFIDWRKFTIEGDW